jgi:hypothetical protein
MAVRPSAARATAFSGSSTSDSRAKAFCSCGSSHHAELHRSASRKGSARNGSQAVSATPSPQNASAAISQGKRSRIQGIDGHVLALEFDASVLPTIESLFTSLQYRKR